MSADEATGTGAVPLRWIREATVCACLRFPACLALLRSSSFGALFFILVAPGCGRSSLELETPRRERRRRPSGNCGPSNCPNGCCDATGVCRIGSDTRACGSPGSAAPTASRTASSSATARRSAGATVTELRPRAVSRRLLQLRERQLEVPRRHRLHRVRDVGATCVDCGQQGRSCDPVQRTCGVGQCDATNCAGCCVGDKCLLGDGQQRLR